MGKKYHSITLGEVLAVSSLSFSSLKTCVEKRKQQQATCVCVLQDVLDYCVDFGKP